jgi:dTDP-4-amino-4,6-dideoxygalactose transaminase
MEKIKMVDLRGQYLRIQPEIDRAIQQVLLSTAFIQGPEVDEFAEVLGSHVGASHTVTCANGTDALQIAMMALDLKAGDEIILPAHTYVATAEVIALLGLTPVFVDVNRDTFNVAVDRIEEKITRRTKAIVPVHLYGQCADMEPILKIARAHKLYVIEDAAQALGAIYRFQDGTQKSAGTMGDIGTTSFFPSKNLGCFGDGGALFTNDKVLADKLKMIANHGQRIKYHHELVGINSRLDTLQAAILKVKLTYLKEYTDKRNDVASFYDKALAKHDFLRVPFRSANSTHVYHQYTLRIENRDRDLFKKHLENQGIPSMIYYPVPLHLQRAYVRKEFPSGSFPVTENLSKTVLSLPIHTEMNREELEYIVEAIAKF